jgi:CRISPR-associated protein Cmr6
MIRGLDIWANQIKTPKRKQSKSVQTHELPMMYRAQVEGRCSLQYIKDNKSNDDSDLEKWINEWVDPQDQSGKPSVELPNTEEIIEEGKVTRYKLNFPFRVISNCGQDSILRPVIDSKGIPIIPGSSVKGLFRRACQKRDEGKNESEQLTNSYCGTQDKPGLLRFHSAYPVGDWASTVQDNGKPTYKMLDVVFPQEDRQLGKNQNKKDKGAFAAISFSKPTFIFTITSTESLSKSEWETVRSILKTGLSKGLGGKTSSGYGLPFLAFRPDLQVRLIGTDLTSSLLNGEFEFRPNLFKAVLRGHASRLLAGYSNNSDFIEGKVKELFGSTNLPSQVEIYCDIKSPPEKWGKSFNDLNLDLSLKIADNSQNKNAKVEFLKTVLKFAYTMGDFGKSWRRVWHKDFYPDKKYTKLIGCHWKSNDDWINDIKTKEDLIKFLNNLDIVCQKYLRITESPIDWRETWHEDRVSIYTSVTEQSRAIGLFHNDTFKTTLAIGGRFPHKNHPKEVNPPQAVSCVWHRMLPISDNKYLEIVTIFHGDRYLWKRNGIDQLKPFIEALKKQGLEHTWGQDLYPELKNP